MRGDVRQRDLLVELRDGVGRGSVGTISKMMRVFGWRGSRRRAAPSLTDAHMEARVKYARMMLDAMQRIESGELLVIDIDEKLFKWLSSSRVLMPGDENGNVTAVVEKVARFFCKSKRHVLQVMLLTALCRPNQYLDGKVYAGSFILKEVAKRTSKYRRAGEIYNSFVNINNNTFYSLIDNELLPAVANMLDAMPDDARPKEVWLQMDNAPPHVGKGMMSSDRSGRLQVLVEKFFKGKQYTVELKLQPAQSPDFNANDGGFFKSCDVRVRRIRVLGTIIFIGRAEGADEERAAAATAAERALRRMVEEDASTEEATRVIAKCRDGSYFVARAEGGSNDDGGGDVDGGDDDDIDELEIAAVMEELADEAEEEVEVAVEAELKEVDDGDESDASDNDDDADDADADAEWRPKTKLGCGSSDEKCCVCGRLGASPVDEGEDVHNWVQCTASNGWFHTACCRLRISEIATEGVDWTCWRCVDKADLTARRAAAEVKRAERAASSAARSAEKAASHKRIADERARVAAVEALPQQMRVANAEPSPADRFLDLILDVVKNYPMPLIAKLFEHKKHVYQSVIDNHGKNYFNLHTKKGKE